MEFFIGWFSKNPFLFSFGKLFSSFGKPTEENGWDNANRKKDPGNTAGPAILSLSKFCYFLTSFPN